MGKNVPTLEEVKEHFKNAKTIKQLCHPYELEPILESIAFDRNSQLYYCDSNEIYMDCHLWDKEEGFYKILTHK